MKSYAILLATPPKTNSKNLRLQQFFKRRLFTNAATGFDSKELRT